MSVKALVVLEIEVSHGVEFQCVGREGGVDKWQRRKKGGLESKVKLNTGPDLGALHFAMARPIIPLARAARTGSFGATEYGRKGRL